VLDPVHLKDERSDVTHNLSQVTLSDACERTEVGQLAKTFDLSWSTLPCGTGLGPEGPHPPRSVFKPYSIWKSLWSEVSPLSGETCLNRCGFKMHSRDASAFPCNWAGNASKGRCVERTNPHSGRLQRGQGDRAHLAQGDASKGWCVERTTPKTWTTTTRARR
jgi:hypothetical protein